MRDVEKDILNLAETFSLEDTVGFEINVATAMFMIVKVVRTLHS